MKQRKLKAQWTETNLSISEAKKSKGLKRGWGNILSLFYFQIPSLSTSAIIQC